MPLRHHHDPQTDRSGRGERFGLRDVFEVSRSGYYRWLKRKGTLNRYEKQHKELDYYVADIHSHYPSQGYRTIADTLLNMYGWVVSDISVWKSMKRLEISAIETGAADKKTLLQDIDRMTDMVNGYLAFARGETPEIEQATELPPTLVRIARDAAPNKQIELDLPDTPAQFYARPMALTRAFANIIENAARYAKNKIKITEHDTPNSIEVIIDDDGCGIPENRRADALRPFVRLDDARGTDTGGTGLGLSIAQTAIENHGGQIFLEDSPLGGLRVRVVLPIE